jgi:pimeloyl-ACP methyl ester carboxylesterase
MHSRYLDHILKYWESEYLSEGRLAERERRLNEFPSFRTEINGLQIHFLHARSLNSTNDCNLLMVHGWPGSFVEFVEVIRLLRNDCNVVVPSIPGYGFSEPPSKKGFDTVEAAVVFKGLMNRLGYASGEVSYFAQGGDWGSMIVSALAQLDPACRGIHLNFFPVVPMPWGPLSMLAGAAYPPLLFSPNDQQRVFPLQSLVVRILKESGYFHEQSTRPDTLSVGLSDSPAGLAAWILEKFRECTCVCPLTTLTLMPF